MTVTKDFTLYGLLGGRYRDGEHPILTQFIKSLQYLGLGQFGVFLLSMMYSVQALSGCTW